MQAQNQAGASRTVDFLRGLRVVELGDSVVSASAGLYLRGFGAEVTKVRHGPPLAERLSAAGQKTPTAYLLRFLDEGKRAIDDPPEDELKRLLERADVVICDIDGQPPPLLRRENVDQYSQTVEALNRGAWVTVSPFGLSGPYRDYRGGELVYLASGGHLAYTRSPTDGSPMKWGGWQGSLVTGDVAGLAALQAYDWRRRDGATVHFEVSAQEALIATGLRLHNAEVFFGPPRSLTGGLPGAPRSVPALSMGVQECKDGFVHISAVELRTRALLLRAIGEPSWADEIVEGNPWAERAAEIHERLRAWTLARTRYECAAELQAQGVPTTPLNSPAQLLRSLQLRARGFFGDGEVRDLPGPTLLRPFGPAPGRDGARQGISSLRVVDLSQVLGPPLAGSWIGAMGADVVKVEDTSREDLQRRIGPFADGEPGPERGGWYAETNFSKKGVLLDLETDAGRGALARLLATSDVVLENTTLTRAKRIGIEPDSYLASGPARLFLSSTGFGRTGPLAAYRTFGVQLEAYGGLMDSTRDRSGALARYNISWADMVTGIYLAGLMASFALSEREERLWADVCMAEVVGRHLAGHLLAAGGGGDDGDEGAWINHLYPFAPHGAYRCGDGDDWLAIAVLTQAEWQSLKEALGGPPELEEASFATPALRYERRDELDAVLEALLRGHDATALFHALQRRGVPAAPAWGAPALADEPHLSERRYFAELTHAVWGRRRVDGLPWRPAGGGPLPIAPAATLGQHNAEVLGPLGALEAARTAG